MRDHIKNINLLFIYIAVFYLLFNNQINVVLSTPIISDLRRILLLSKSVFIVYLQTHLNMFSVFINLLFEYNSMSQNFDLLGQNKFVLHFNDKICFSTN